MKKLIALILAVATLASVGAVAGAASETVLTTTVPAATYTLNIPANQEIPFGAKETDIGNISVTEATGFAVGKNLAVTVTYDDFKAENVSTTIPFTLRTINPNPPGNGNPATRDYTSGTIMKFTGKDDGTVGETVFHPGTPAKVEQFYLCVKSADWGIALAGEYSATITFTAEVVVDTTA